MAFLSKLVTTESINCKLYIEENMLNNKKYIELFEVFYAVLVYIQFETKLILHAEYTMQITINQMYSQRLYFAILNSANIVSVDLQYKIH